MEKEKRLFQIHDKNKGDFVELMQKEKRPFGLLNYDCTKKIIALIGKTFEIIRKKQIQSYY